MFSFDAEPAIGTVLHLDDQAYEMIGTKPHERQDGTSTELLIWQTECATCGSNFEVMSGLRSSGLSRRCAEHRRAGKPVKGKRGRKVVVEIDHA